MQTCRDVVDTKAAAVKKKVYERNQTIMLYTRCAHRHAVHMSHTFRKRQSQDLVDRLDAFAFGFSMSTTNCVTDPEKFCNWKSCFWILDSIEQIEEADARN